MKLTARSVITGMLDRVGLIDREIIILVINSELTLKRATKLQRRSRV